MKESFYFSHDYNARNDEKILELRAEFGAEGYGVFWMLIESMAESSDGRLNRGAIGGLSLGYGVAKDTLSKILDFCIKIGLFILDTDGYFHPKRLDEHKNLRKMLSEKGKQGALKMWERKKNEDANGGAIRDGISEGNAKKRKGKKKKVNIDIGESEIPDTDRKDESKKFTPPTKENALVYLKEYCKTKNKMLRDFENESERFIDYHTAREWKLKGGKRISDWQACVRTWVSNIDTFNSSNIVQNNLFQKTNVTTNNPTVYKDENGKYR